MGRPLAPPFGAVVMAIFSTQRDGVEGALCVLAVICLLGATAWDDRNRQAGSR